MFYLGVARTHQCVLSSSQINEPHNDETLKNCGLFTGVVQFTKLRFINIIWAQAKKKNSLNI